jgi:hypothetical protein
VYFYRKHHYNLYRIFNNLFDITVQKQTSPLIFVFSIINRVTNYKQKYTILDKKVNKMNPLIGRKIGIKVDLEQLNTRQVYLYYLRPSFLNYSIVSFADSLGSFMRDSARISCQTSRAKSTILFSCLALGLLTTLLKYSKALSLEPVRRSKSPIR